MGADDGLGAIEPSSFGDFFPEAEFIGRKEQMAEYFGQMPADFQAKFNGSVASYKNYASSKFTHEIGDKLGEKPPITSIEPHEKPSWFETEKSYNTLGAVILTTNGLLAACKDLKNLIEHLEPGVHTFWPIQFERAPWSPS